MLSNEEFSNDAEIDEESTAKYYLRRGLDAMRGSENTLQDYTAAHGFFEKAIALGDVLAHWWLADMYIAGEGVRQSSEMALKILQAGGDKGDPGCYKRMWDIYAGDTALDLNHEGNAEVCFQWFLDASKEGVDTDDLRDYLNHSYKKLDGDVGNKYRISRFPGKFVSTAIDWWCRRVQQACRQIRDARLSGVSLDQVGAIKDINTPLRELFTFQHFLSNCIYGHHDLMQRAMDGIEIEDLEYGFPKNIVDNFMPYFSVQSAQSANLPTEDVPVIQQPAPGFFRRLFS